MWVPFLGLEDPLEKGMATQYLQYSCLENPMDKGDGRATVHGVAKSWTYPSEHTQFIYVCKNILFFNLLLKAVAMCGLSLVAESRGYCPLAVRGLLITVASAWNTDSRQAAFSSFRAQT